MKQLYFAYGMNTNLDSMNSRCPGATVLGPAVLEGYRFQFRRHADVELDDASEVHGVLWQIDSDHLDSLDILEGFPRYYLRTRVWVKYMDNWHIAWVYTMAEQEYVWKPDQYYLDMCLEGYNQNNVDTQQIYQALKDCTNEKLAY